MKIGRSLLPNVALIDGWRRYIEVDMVRALSYIHRVQRIYQIFKENPSSENVKKSVMGVIGKDTIGHWKDVQSIYRDFFGILCRNCVEAVRRIGMGIPFEDVVSEVSLVFGNSGLVRYLDSIANLLHKIAGNSFSLDVVENTVENDLSRLAQNPLHIQNIIKGLYSMLINILPLYNEYTMFVIMTRSIPLKYYRKLFNGIDLADLSKIGLRFGKVEICRNDDYALYIHGDGVEGFIDKLVYEVYEFLRHSLRSMKKRFSGLKDEEKLFIDSMYSLVNDMHMMLDVKRPLNIVKSVEKHNTSIRIGAGYRYLKARMLIDLHRDIVIISERYRCEEFIDAFSPYMVLGLSWIDGFELKNDRITATLHMYVKH